MQHGAWWVWTGGPCHPNGQRPALSAAHCYCAVLFFHTRARCRRRLLRRLIKQALLSETGVDGASLAKLPLLERAPRLAALGYELLSYDGGEPAYEIPDSQRKARVAMHKVGYACKSYLKFDYWNEKDVVTQDFCP